MLMWYWRDWRKSIKMPYKIKFTDYAETDLEGIGDYIAFEKKNGFAAIKMI